ncbi:MAG: translocation/assembly module TamB domain-containing protein [Pseudomonadota bacterium]
MSPRVIITALVWTRRMVLVVGWLAVGLVLLTATVLWWLTSTSAGVQWSLEQAQRHLPLTVERVEGTPWRGLSLHGVIWGPSEGPVVRVDTARLSIDAGGLWRARLLAPEVFARGVELQLPVPGEQSAPAQSPPFSPGSLPLPPWLLDLPSVRIESLVVSRGEERYRLDRLALAARLDARLERPRFDVALDELSLWLPGSLGLDVDGEFGGELADGIPVAGQLTLLVDHPDGWLGGRVDIGGSALSDLVLRPRLDWMGTNGLPAAACGQLHYDGERLAIVDLGIDILGGRLRVAGALTPGEAPALRLDGQAESIDPSWLAAKMPGSLGFGFSAQLAIDDGWLPLAGRVVIEGLTGDLAGGSLRGVSLDAVFDDQAATVALSGQAAEGDLRLDARLGADQSFSMDWALDALSLAVVAADDLGLSLASNGRIAGRLPDWRKPLTGRDWLERTTVEIERLHATLSEATAAGERGRQVTLDAEGSVADGAADLRGARLVMPGGQLSVGGRLALPVGAESWRLDQGELTLSVPDLARLPWDLFERVPGLDLAALQPETAGGRIEAEVTASGTAGKPQGRLSIRGGGLRLAGHALEHLDADGSLGEDDALTLSADARRLILSGGDFPAIDRLAVRADGSVPAHRLRVDLEAGPALTLIADGGWTGSEWAGQLTGMDASVPQAGDWQLAGDALLHLGGDRQRLESFCLQPAASGTDADRGQLCLNAENGAGQTQATLKGDLSLMALWQQWEGGDPEQLRLPGRVRIDGSARMSSGETEAELAVDLPADEMRIARGVGEDRGYETVAYPPGRLAAGLAGDRVTGRLEAGLADWLALRAEGQATLSDQRLDTSLDLERADLAPLLAFAERVAGPFDWPVGDIDGELTGEMGAVGRWTEPEMTARLRLRELAFSAFPAGTAYRDGRLDVDLARDGGIRLEGELTGEADTPPRPVFQERRIVETEAGRTVGRMTVSGEGQLTAPDDWQLALTVAGEPLPVLRLPTLTVDARPDLKLDLEPAGGQVSGAIHLPVVIAKLEELPKSARRNSEDLVIVGEESPKPGAGYPLTGDIDVILGDDVSLRGKGFASRLVGGLTLRLRPEQSPGAFGELRLAEGRYQAYGQDLRIERGRLIFNGPLTAPGLDVVASRQIDDADGTVVGLSIQGELEAPDTEVFSRPATSQSDALSLLLTGRRLSAGSEGDASLLMAAITGLGVRQGDSLAQQINATLGFDELGLESGGDAAGTSLSVGKRIGENLLVRYAVGVFDGVGELITRYRINKFLHLELTSSAESQSGDLIYQIDTGRRKD